MTHTYPVTGMTCGSCEAKVKSALLTLADVTNVEVTRTSATITMQKHISLNDLQKAIGTDGKYKISATQHNEVVEQTKSCFITYKPLLIQSRGLVWRGISAA